MHTLAQLRSGALQGIRRLDLSAGLTTLPPEVYDLADTLEVLNLSDNLLQDLPDDLPRLHRLTTVYASNNRLTRLPEVLGACPHLRIIGARGNQIAELPSRALPPRLRWLTLTDNALTQLPAELGGCQQLQKLMLAGNRLSQLPDAMAGLTALELLRLAANPLQHWPAWLTELPRLAWLALSGHQLVWPSPGLAPLAAWDWQQLQVGPLLGEGASGLIHSARRGRAGQLAASATDAEDPALALKLFKGAMTSDGLPEHELQASLVAGRHPQLCTPVTTLSGHPDGVRGLLLPLIPPDFAPLAGPPSLASCSRDVYDPALRMPWPVAQQLLAGVASAVAHLHRRGVMHGDLYAHNILWQQHSGQAWLTDFGAASLLPLHQPELARALQALEVRAFGILADEVLTRCQPADGEPAACHSLRPLLAACLSEVATQRPTMAELSAALGPPASARDAASAQAPV
ncbi:lipopolysaccharide kinase InaA family protein [Ideonella sp.]|uniref:lipopolysaccharide kinase InaA family protein n=1 Tax=Ideonella sp. TaxID=1929293 RepID=UPI003BB4E7A4